MSFFLFSAQGPLSSITAGRADKGGDYKRKITVYD